MRIQGLADDILGGGRGVHAWVPWTLRSLDVLGI